MAGPLANAGVLVVGAAVLGSVVVGACGGIGGGGRRSLPSTQLTLFRKTQASNPADAYARHRRIGFHANVTKQQVLGNLRGMGMRRTTKIVNLAAALGALVAPAAAPEIANATNSDEAHSATNSDEVQLAKAAEAKAQTKLPRGEELMRFTVHTSSDGTPARQASHDSHASHSSHASHASSS